MGNQLLNGSNGSKFIVRSVSGSAIKDGAATQLRFIKNRRLIVQESVTHTPLAHTYFLYFLWVCFPFMAMAGSVFLYNVETGKSK